jgi:hypothetical protein
MTATYDIHWGDVDLDGCDRICIDHRENICSVCAKPYLHHKRYFWKEEDKTIKEVHLVTAHAGCRSLLSKIEEHQQKILELEFKLYVLKTS